MAAAQHVDAFTAAGADADVRVVVPASEGPSFSAGADLEWPPSDEGRGAIRAFLEKRSPRWQATTDV